MALRVYWVPSPKFTAGHPAALIAFVCHRMVGTLKSTDTTFTTGTRIASTNFGVGYGCGKTGHPTGAHVHQYVRLGDQAWGNGNWDATGKWDDRYPVTNLNSRTISIEHHDNGGAPLGTGRGIVPPEVQKVSQELIRLLLWNDVPTMKAAGVQFRSGTETAIGRELRALRALVDTNHIIDHNYIAGRLKPFCWKPWADDKVGFPQAAYIAAIKATVPAPPTGDAVQSFAVPKAPQVATVRDGAWLYVSTELDPDPANIQISPGRDLPYHGVQPGCRIVEYVDSSGVHTGKAYFVKDADVLGYKTATAPAPPDTSPYTQAQLDAAKVAAAKTGYNEGLESAESVVAAIPRR